MRPDARPTPETSSPQDGASHGAPAAVQGIFLLMLLGFIHLAREFLLPVILSLLLFFVFVPLQRRLQNAGLHGTSVAAVLVLGLLVVMVSIFVVLSGPVFQIIENLPEIVQDISGRLDSAREALMTIAEGVRSGGPADVPQLRPTIASDENEDSDGDLLFSTASGALVYLTEAPLVVGQFLLILLLLFFMLSSSDLLYLKVIQSFDAFGDKRMALATLRQVEEKLGGYLGTITLINLGLGICIGLALWALGMPVPLMFGVLAFLLNFIPFAGALIGVVLATAVALLWFDTLGSVVLVGLVYLSLTSLEGNLVTPSILARRLRMNTVLVVLSIAFWAWIWSFMGMIIAVPMLVALRVITEQVPRWQKIANVLSGDKAALHFDPMKDTKPL
ncbi:MAG: AI-2E family transporter [Rhodobacteraceae bacterium]|nr:MAG: AI-2E family transporter [Paracoccaceae bacterium]